MKTKSSTAVPALPAASRILFFVGLGLGAARPCAASDTDPHSFSRPSEVVVKHLDLDLAVDFGKKELRGTAALAIENRSGAKQLVLDTRDLAIESVTLEPGGAKATFALGDAVPILGRPLAIDIAPATESVAIRYATSPSAAALQWLEPAQTAGGKQPILFTQSESILARTWVPCQDSPAVRMTYRAKIKTPPALMAVMSARNGTKRNMDGAYEFDMPQPVPSYLLALAVGDIDFRPTGPRTGMYAEPSVVEKAAWEFAETEKMIQAAESLYGPYRWERYDLIVLPPSFPFGGMENPRLTFATPTVIAGDRSLVALVAHELAHSWSGNLVTNATWNDFWLNEGFTVYLEHRIMEAVYGRDYSEMLAEIELGELRRTIQELKPTSPDTALRLHLEGRDPDDGMTDVAYEKGYFFLRLAEESVGRPAWDAFLKSYFDTFAFQSMTTDRFVERLRTELLPQDSELAKKIDVDAWVYGPGLPANCPSLHSRALEQAAAQADRFAKGEPARSLDTAGWSTHQWLHFLRHLPASLPQERMADLDSTFHFTDRGNSELLGDWLLNVIANRYAPAYPKLEEFLVHVGRRKYLKPIYAKLAETPDGLERARRIYATARPGYHSVSTGTIDEILHWQS